jgi:hypothetical protein
MSIEELNTGYGSAIFSLLKERVIIHNMVGEDFRSQARDRTLTEISEGTQRKIY